MGINMIRPKKNIENIDALDASVSLYDPDPIPDEDLWFLPEAQSQPDDLPPLPRADRRPLFDPDAWRAAQAGQTETLADLAYHLGALEARLHAGPNGWRQSLALTEVEGLSWWAGDRISSNRLILWQELNLPGAQEDAQALSRAAWAYRRLVSGADLNDFSSFLGRSNDPAITDLADVLGNATGLHPLARGALAFHAWRVAAPRGAATNIEAAVIGACIAGQGGRNQAPAFLPLATTGFSADRASADPNARLAVWLGSANKATLGAHLMLDRLEQWQTRAQQAVAGLSGRTPAALVDLFMSAPAVTAPLAQARLEAGRSTIQRNLDLLQARNLIREITGQGRYRMWEIKM